jgi:glycosyltransferase involved in cell wall biosynthesis
MNSAPFNQIIYYCGEGDASWNPEDKTLGGSEQAVVQLSEHWTRKGYIVKVYGRIESKVVNGVSYLPTKELDLTRSYNIFIIWRGHAMNQLNGVRPSARVVLLDLHDFSDAVRVNQYQPIVDKIMLKSKFHQKLYPFLVPQKVFIYPNGIQLNNYYVMKNNNYKREPFRFCYTSSYDRGLEELLRYSWPEIHRQLPGSELHVYYGISVWDPRKDVYEPLLKQAGVIHHGRVANQVVAEEKYRSSMNLYPSHCESEIDCINVRESAVAGCVPVLSDFGVFAERDGVHVHGNPKHQSFHPEYIRTVVELARNPQRQEQIRKEIEKSDLLFGWDSTGDKWIEVFKKELSKKTPF